MKPTDADGMAEFRRPSLGTLSALWGLVWFLGGGCASPSPAEKREEAALGTVVHPARLTGDLQTFGSHYAATLAGVMSTIAANTADRSIREKTYLVKLSGIPGMAAAVANPDPRLAFVDAWTACVQGRLYFTEGLGKDAYGDQQALAVDALQRLEREISDIGRKHFGAEIIEEAAPNIERFAKTQPFSYDSELGSPGPETAVGSSWDRTLLSVVSTPLAPLRGIEGVGDTPSAINKVAQTVTDFTRVVRQLPAIIRWQSELLLLELDSLPSVVEARKSMDRVSTAAESFSKTAETLPGEFRQEVEAAIQASEESQEAFRATLAEARKTVEDVTGSLEEAKGTAQSVRDAAAKLAETAAAWEATAKAVNGVLVTYRGISGDEGESDAEPVEPEEEGPSDIELYAQAAVEIRKGAEELRALMLDVESGRLDRAIEKLGRAPEASLDHATLRAGELVDRITVRVLAVIGVLLIAFLVYRIATARWRRK
jgi:hypothetical protein